LRGRAAGSSSVCACKAQCCLVRRMPSFAACCVGAWCIPFTWLGCGTLLSALPMCLTAGLCGPASDRVVVPCWIVLCGVSQQTLPHRFAQCCNGLCRQPCGHAFYGKSTRRTPTCLPASPTSRHVARSSNVSGVPHQSCVLVCGGMLTSHTIPHGCGAYRRGVTLHECAPLAAWSRDGSVAVPTTPDECSLTSGRRGARSIRSVYRLCCNLLHDVATSAGGTRAEAVTERHDRHHQPARDSAVTYLEHCSYSQQ
jgi:hypothetical protein